METWTTDDDLLDDLYRVSGGTGQCRPPSDFLKNDRCKQRTDDSSSDTDEDNEVPYPTGGRGYLTRDTRKPGGVPSQIKDTILKETQRHIREVMGSGHTNEEIEDYLRSRRGKPCEETVRRGPAVPDLKLKPKYSGVAADAATVRPSATHQQTVVQKRSPTPNKSKLNALSPPFVPSCFRDGNENGIKYNLNSKSDFPQLK